MYRWELYVREMNSNQYASPLRILQSTIAPQNQGGKARKYLSLGRGKWGRVGCDVCHMALFIDPCAILTLAITTNSDGGWKQGKYLLRYSEGGYKSLFVRGYSRSSHFSWGRTMKRRHAIDRSVFLCLFTVSQLSTGPYYYIQSIL